MMLLPLIQQWKHFLFIMVILLLPFQDSGLKEVSHFAGSRLSTLPLMALVMLTFFEYLCVRKYVSKRLVKFFALSSLYILTISIIPILWDYIDSFYMDQILRTLFVNFVITSTKVFFLCYVVVFFSKKEYKFVQIAFVLVCVGYIVDIMGINLGYIVHLMPTVSDGEVIRPRGFSMESSTFGSTSVVLGCLAAAVAKNKTLKKIFFSVVILLAWLSTSKGTVVVLLSVASFYVFKASVHFTWKLLLFILVFLFGIYFWNNSLAFVIGVVSDEAYSTMSFTTRFCSMMASFLMLYDYPLGLGISAVYGLEYIKDVFIVYDELNAIVGIRALDDAELLSIVRSGILDPSATISARSGFFANLAYYGVPFVFLFFKFVYQVQVFLKKEENMILWIGFMFSVGSIILYTEINYDILMLWGGCLALFKEKAHNLPLYLRWMDRSSMERKTYHSNET